ncbi:metal transporter uex isoform X6 [Lycorma delicatula]|uniref:metal transporter uex isoform X6 n=1 Tax=Lycorma delicatula TaxID=130591 RepID=UPI003F51A9A8
MARDVVSVSIYITYFLTILYVSKAKVLSELVPIVKSISVINETSVTNQSSEMFSKIIVEMRGYNFYSGMKVRATTNPEYGECSESISDSDSEHDFSELWSNSTLSLMALYIKLKPGINNQNFYVCVRSVERTTTTGDQSTFISTFPSEVIKWVHQGKNVVFRTASEYVFKSLIEGVNPSEQIGTRRRVEREGETWNTKVHQNVTQYEGADVAYNTEPHKDGINKTPLPNLVIYGYRLEDSDKEARFIQGTPQLRVGSSGVLRLFGRGWTGNTYFTLTSKKGEKGQHCEVPIDDKFKLTTEYSELEKDEVNIISGALELRKKIVADVMTKLEDVYMLSYDAVLDFETVSEIMKSGYSRIPVYETHRYNVVTMLYIKDLALVDPDDNTPLKTLCQFYQNPCYFVFEDMTLDVLFKQFKEGNKGHMAFVHRVNNEGEGDPFYETVGIITLEDVIEELIQAEIMDETDVWTDNRTKHRRSARNIKQDFTAFAERSEVQRIHISPQLTLATFQYLSTSVDPFKPEVISESVLSRLLKQDIIHHIKVKKDKSKNDPDTIIYQQGKPVDYFVLILEGRVEVTVGRENLVFESGPFTYFGLQALMQTVGVAESPTGIASASQQLGSLQSVNLDAMLRHSFVPDYTVRAITEVFYLSVKRSLFLAAKRATLMERSKKEEVQSGDVFDAEVEKLSREDMDAETKIVDSTNKPESQVVNNKSGTASSKPNVTFNEKVLKKSSKIPLKSNEQESVGFNVFSYNVSCVDQNRPTTSCFNATSNTDESLSVEIFEDLLS